MRSSKALPVEIRLAALAASLLTRRWPRRNAHGRQTGAGSNAQEPHRSKGRGPFPFPSPMWRKVAVLILAVTIRAI